MSNHAASAVTVRRQSSPRYPFIPLPEALDRADQFRLFARNKAAFVDEARKVWNYGLKSSGGGQTAAALCYYGLLEEIGKGSDREVKLTEAALQLEKEERGQVRADLLCKFALAPVAMRMLWELWQHEPPEESIARSILETDLHFSRYASTEFFAIYKLNLLYIPHGTSIPPLYKASKPRPKIFGARKENPRSASAKIGDFVQWTCGGVDQLKTLARVTWVSDDQLFLRIEGTQTGIPMSEVTVSDPPTPRVAADAEVPSAGGGRDLNVHLTGKRLHVTADVDLAGLKRLNGILTRYEGILELMDS